MEMLRGHYLCEILSMQHIAEFGGYSTYRSGNSLYGRLSAKIAKELNYKPKYDKTSTIAEVIPERDENGHCLWKMDDEMIEAIRRVGWFKETHKEKLREDVVIEATEREATIRERIGQSLFRSKVIKLWRGKCAVTGCPLCDVLIASHIMPWAICKASKQCHDPHNGLLLTPNLDKLFDQFLISFKDDGAILISNRVKKISRTVLGVSEENRLRFVPEAMKHYLEWHRQKFYAKQRNANS